MFRNLGILTVTLILVFYQVSSIQIVEVPPEIMTQRMNSLEIHDLEDIETPVGVGLSGKYKR